MCACPNTIVLLLRTFAVVEERGYNNSVGNGEDAEGPNNFEKGSSRGTVGFDGKMEIKEACLHELKFLGAFVKDLEVAPIYSSVAPKRMEGNLHDEQIQDIQKTRVIVNAWAIA